MNQSSLSVGFQIRMNEKDQCVTEYFISGHAGHVIFQIFSIAAFLLVYSMSCVLFCVFYGAYISFQNFSFCLELSGSDHSC